jgi:hypothetical protein
MRTHLKIKLTRVEMAQLFWIVVAGLVAMALGIYIGVLSSGDHNAFD